MRQPVLTTGPQSQHRADLRRHRRSSAHPGRAGRRRSAGCRGGLPGLARAAAAAPTGPARWPSPDRPVPAGRPDRADRVPVDVDPPLGRPVVRHLAEVRPQPAGRSAQELQFGYNNDYLDILVDRRGRTALLCCNHEYTNRAIMFPPTSSPEQEAEVLRTLMAAHGFSVVELERRARKQPWRYRRDGRRNRRITASTPFRLTGPARERAGHHGRRSDRSHGARHLRQLRRRHHPVGDDPVRGGELPGLLRRRSGRAWQQALRPDQHSERVRLGGDRATLRRHQSRVCQRAAPVRLHRRDRPVRAVLDAAQAHGHGPTQARGRERPGRTTTAPSWPTWATTSGSTTSTSSSRSASTGRATSTTARRHNLKILTEGDLYVARFSGTQRPDGANLGRGVWLPLVLDGESKVPRDERRGGAGLHLGGC